MRDGVDASQRVAARVVGVCYLFAMAAAVFSESYVRGTLVVADSATLTAQHIGAHMGLYRLGAASEILTFVSDVTLIASLYVILAPVQRYLALLATFLRMAEVAVCAVMAAGSYDALRILGDAPYLKALGPDQLAVLARLSIGSHGTEYNVAFVFLGLGSTVFGFLWLQSRFVPKALAILGIVASSLLAVGTFAILLAPGLGRVLSPAYLVPMFFFEVGMGLYLLVWGLRTPAPLSASR